ncbi:4-hydroxy-tetrahydrodipicolinate synthase [Paraburkholderia sp. Ac-20340]|uniref:4-hydroxy-tetrahydrodipicolinate synthase family protein n=1 Tax=Paraburkholderia sp. Ac-20340 TaxID=2703888 RepID=UPI00197F6EE3|nr:4-hydroxy-tetrahydrodipicolinate synthase [Paraburkholderia sp. Ac-20340]MBN3854083.1 4-hydroxy-tetrahydrodipicolinate synthase [Paraburkholderia sp. Ac-20340]
MYKGIWLPLVTPFREGTVDVAALEVLTELSVDSGIAGLVALGTTGEAALLDRSERSTVMQAIIEVVAGRIPVIAGVGGIDTADFVDEIHRLEVWDLAGYLVSAPAYLCPNQAGLLWHFTQTAQVTGRDIVLYDVPHRTGVGIFAETVSELIRIPNIKAIKACARERFDAFGALPIAMLCGNDDAFLDCLRAGATGGILASAHVCADLLAHVQQLFSAGQGEEATQLFAHLEPVLRLLFAAPNPSAIKAMMSLDASMRAETRMPITPADETLVRRLAAARIELDELRALIGQPQPPAQQAAHALLRRLRQPATRPHRP